MKRAWTISLFVAAALLMTSGVTAQAPHTCVPVACVDAEEISVSSHPSEDPEGAPQDDSDPSADGDATPQDESDADGPTPATSEDDSGPTAPGPGTEAATDEPATKSWEQIVTDGWVSWSASLPPYVEYILGAILTFLVSIQVAITFGGAWALQAFKRLAWLSVLPVFFLFSRIRSSKVLDQPVRAQLMHIIQERPGVDVDTLSRSSNVAWSTARHHLDHLERHDMVRSVRSGTHLIYFAQGSDDARSRKDLAVLRGSTRRRVVHAILDSPGTTNAAIADRLGLTRPSVTHHLNPLIKAGLVDARRQGRQQTLMADGRLADLMGVHKSVKAPAAPAPVSFRVAPATRAVPA